MVYCKYLIGSIAVRVDLIKKSESINGFLKIDLLL